MMSIKILQKRATRFHVWQSRNTSIGLSDRIFRLRKHVRRRRSYVNFRTNWRSLRKKKGKSEESYAIGLVQFSQIFNLNISIFPSFVATLRSWQIFVDN